MALDTGLKLYYKHDESGYTNTAGEVLDSSPNNYHGDPDGGLTTGASGLMGRCLDGNGTGKITVPGFPKVSSTQGLTVRTWIKFKDVPFSEGRAFLGRFNGGRAYDLGHYSYSGFAGFMFLVGNNYISYDPAISIGAWYQVVGRYDRSSGLSSLWLNGAKQAEQDLGDPAASDGDGGVTYVGAFHNGSGLLKDCHDETAILMRSEAEGYCWSDAEIIEDYNSGAGVNLLGGGTPPVVAYIPQVTII